MSGFFTRLAQRALGTGKAVRPSIAPRFAQAPATTNDTPSADPIEDLDQQPNGISNKTDKPKSQTPGIGQVQANRMDSPHLQEQQRQAESRQAHPVDQYPGHHERQAEQEERDANIVKFGTVETKNRIDRVKPIEGSKNDIETPNILDETESQIVQSDHANIPGPPDLEHDQFTGKGPPADAPLVPMPLVRSQGVESPITHFADLSYPVDVHLVPGMDGRKSADRTRQQGSDESQTINVTIGRIEVRAIHPPPAPIKQGKSKTNPALSLDDYLQQRRKGER